MTASTISASAQITTSTGAIIESRWKSLYRVGGISTLVMAAFAVIQIGFFIIWPYPNTVSDWFNLFAHNRLLGLLQLDLLLIADSLLTIPMVLALFAALHKTDMGWMTLGMVLGLISVSAYFAANPAFNMLVLSDQYAAAATDAQRNILLAAGQTALSMWNGTAFDVYYVLGSVAPIIFCTVMLRSQTFSRLTAYLGIVANVIALGLFVPGIGPYISVGSVVILEAWFILMGLRLLALSQSAEGSKNG